MSIDTMNEAVSEAVDTVADLGTNVAQGRHVPRRGQWQSTASAWTYARS